MLETKTANFPISGEMGIQVIISGHSYGGGGGGMGSMQAVGLNQCFSTAGPRPGTGPWHQLYQDARGSPGSCHFSFLSIFH
jgi:hypothetical protein